MGGWGRGDSRERSRASRAPRDARDARDASDRYGERSRERYERGYERVYSRSEARRSRSRKPEILPTPPVREALPRRRRVPNDDAADGSAPGTTAAVKVKPRRPSKWDDRGDGAGAAVPDWVKDLEPRLAAAPALLPPSAADGGPMVSRDSLRRKTMRLKSVQIRVLLGRGGENIKQICEKTNAEIKVDHDRISDEGDLNITGDVVRTEALIRETLAQKGCPMDDEQQPVDDLLQVPGDMVGLFIGRGGEHIKAIRDACGGSLYIGVNPPPNGEGLHKIQIVGDQREKAREMVLLRLKEMWEAEAKKEAEARPPAPLVRPAPPMAPMAPMAPTAPKAPAMAAMAANVAKFNTWGSWDDWSDWWADSHGYPHGMQPGMFHGMASMAPMAPMARRPKAPAPAPPKAPVLAPQWMGEMQPVVEAPSTQLAEPEAEIEEENPWAGIVPECELPS